MNNYPYTAREIRDAAAVLYAMEPGTRESAAAHGQMLRWAARCDVRTAGQAAFLAARPEGSWTARSMESRARWEAAAAAAIEFAGRPTEEADTAGPVMRVGDTVLVLPHPGQDHIAFHVATVVDVIDARIDVRLNYIGGTWTVHRDALLVRDAGWEPAPGSRVHVPENATWGTPEARVRPGIRGYDAEVESGRTDTDGDLYVRRAVAGEAGYVRAGQVFPADAVERAAQGATL